MSATGAQAPELRVQHWIGGDGHRLDVPLKLSDIGSGPKILFAFQHWCRGCHLHGFPTLQRLHGALECGFQINGTSIPVNPGQSFH